MDPRYLFALPWASPDFEISLDVEFCQNPENSDYPITSEKLYTYVFPGAKVTSPNDWKHSKEMKLRILDPLKGVCHVTERYSEEYLLPFAKEAREKRVVTIERENDDFQDGNMVLSHTVHQVKVSPRLRFLQHSFNVAAICEKTDDTDLDVNGDKSPPRLNVSHLACRYTLVEYKTSGSEVQKLYFLSKGSRMESYVEDLITEFHNFQNCFPLPPNPRKTFSLVNESEILKSVGHFVVSYSRNDRRIELRVTPPSNKYMPWNFEYLFPRKSNASLGILWRTGSAELQHLVFYETRDDAVRFSLPLDVNSPELQKFEEISGEAIRSTVRESEIFRECLSISRWSSANFEVPKIRVQKSSCNIRKLPMQKLKNSNLFSEYIDASDQNVKIFFSKRGLIWLLEERHEGLLLPGTMNLYVVDLAREKSRRLFAVRMQGLRSLQFEDKKLQLVFEKLLNEDHDLTDQELYQEIDLMENDEEKKEAVSGIKRKGRKRRFSRPLSRDPVVPEEPSYFYYKVASAALVATGCLAWAYSFYRVPVDKPEVEKPKLRKSKIPVKNEMVSSFKVLVDD